MRTNLTKRVVLGAAALSMLFAGSAFTASNTMPAETKAGAGTVSISGYTAQKIDYALNATDPSTIDSVAIDIAGAVNSGGTAKLQLNTTPGTWYSCVIGSLTDPDSTPDNGDEYTPLTCDTTGEAVDTANNLTLVIAD
jgi:hypothetical protein